MNSGNGSGQDDVDFGPALQQYLAGDKQALNTLAARERGLVLMLAPAFELKPDDDTVDSSTSSAAQAPPLEQDPIAIALGLIPGPEDVLSSRALQRARKAAHINLDVLVRRLQERAWDVTVEEVFGWHRTDTKVAPALMKAIAATLDVPPRSLRGPAVGKINVSISAVLDDEAIANYLIEWAAETGEEPVEVRDRVKRTLASASYRNHADISRDEVLAILRALRNIDPRGASR